MVSGEQKKLPRVQRLLWGEKVLLLFPYWGGHHRIALIERQRVDAYHFREQDELPQVRGQVGRA